MLVRKIKAHTKGDWEPPNCWTSLSPPGSMCQWTGQWTGAADPSPWHDYTMNFICNLTRDTILAQETAKLYCKHVFSRTGLSQVIHSDRRSQFIAQFWRHCWKKLQTSAPHHPQSNPYVERQNKTFKEASVMPNKSTTVEGGSHFLL